MWFAKSARTFIVALVSVFLASPPVTAQTYTVLYRFKGGSDGAAPIGGLILDSAGNLYGTAAGNLNLYGPPSGTTAGSVYMLSSSGKFTLLHNFAGGGSDGAWPAAGLVRGADGNLYGTTSGGGSANLGTVFKLDSQSNFTVPHSFTGGRDGAQPLVPLILDGAGNLYGTTYLGGAPKCNVGNNGACGSVFTVTMTGKKAGKEKVLFRFSSPKKYGSFPYGSLMLDSAGNLYGTASLNGPGHEGVVLKLGASGGATVLHSFSFHPDGVPSSALIQDAAGNLYGTTGVGAGDVYELDPLGNETVLHIFGGSEGTEPFQSGVIMDGDGNLYGTMYSGGNEVACNGYYPGCGVVYKLDPSGNDTVLYTFSGGKDGANPQFGVVMDSAGNLYGTTAYGGTVNKSCPAGCGVVFKLTP